MTEKKNFATQYHRPVLLDETLAALDIRPDSVYLDGTAGGGGHSTAIASRLTTGRLIALDQDPDAVREASRRLEGLPAVVVRSNFTAMDQVLEELGVKAVDGILLDIGVSSHQLDAPERGFSYHHDAPLDMRMSQSGSTAAEAGEQLVCGRAGGYLFPLRGREVLPAHRPGYCPGTAAEPIVTTADWPRLLKALFPRRSDGRAIPPARYFRRCASR